MDDVATRQLAATYQGAIARSITQLRRSLGSLNCAGTEMPNRLWNVFAFCLYEKSLRRFLLNGGTAAVTLHLWLVADFASLDIYLA